MLQALLRVDTVNPPGNETRAAEVLRDYLSEQAIPCELVARTPERANLVARLEGGDGPSLAFICHTDTVLADPEEWARDPWSGDLVDGEVWGRGALDMKDQVAASAVAFASLWREGFRPAGDLVFAATADEEVGDGFGLEWLVSQHPELVRVDYAINEGGGERIRLGDSVYYLCGTAEKMSAPFLLRVRGRSGHASVPSIADNALVKAAPLLEALGSLRVAPTVIPELERFLAVTLGEVPAAEDVLARVSAELGPGAVELVEPLLSLTVSPTQDRGVAGGERDPCGVRGDRGLPPASRTAAGRRRAGDSPRAGRRGLGAEWIESTEGRARRSTRPLWTALDEFVAGIEPGARLLPLCNAGFTDSALPAGGVRDGRVRLLPAACDGWRARSQARAIPPTSGCPWTTSSSESRCCAWRCAHCSDRRARATVDRGRLRADRSLAPRVRLLRAGGRGSRPDLFLGSGSRRDYAAAVAGSGRAVPGVAAGGVRRAGGGARGRHREWRRLSHRLVGEVVDSGRVRRRGAAGAGRDRAWQCLPGQPRAAPIRLVQRRPDRGRRAASPRW